MAHKSLPVAFLSGIFLTASLLISFNSGAQINSQTKNSEAGATQVTEASDTNLLKNYLEQYYKSITQPLPPVPVIKKNPYKKAKSPRQQNASVLAKTPKLVIIIDDIGNNKEMDLKAAGLPGAVTLAILPHTPHSQTIATLAFKNKKEIILHAPMESIEDKNLGKGGLTEAMTEEEFTRTLQNDIDSIPHLVGLSNHMGSLLTQNENAMSWLMASLTKNNLFFVDSRTTAASVASDLASKHNIEHVSRDVFLDHEANTEYTDKAFKKALRISKKTGFAVAIGHPYPTTLSYLETHLGKLEQEGVQLIPVSELLKFQKGPQEKTLPEK